MMKVPGFGGGKADYVAQGMAEGLSMSASVAICYATDLL
jgi:hypothetical protein